MSEFQERFNIGKRIKELRENNNISATYLAKQINVNNSTLTRIEKGYDNPSINKLEKICSIFEITIGEFFLTYEEIDKYCNVNNDYAKIIRKAIAYDITPEHLNSMIDLLIDSKRIKPRRLYEINTSY